ncbi:Gmad2 immunoglobulin-like domain-containing protein [Phycicoccus sp. Soil748]|uniref:Gmad2 immunoglobulin-like domain-containing protein n=1 Tax=Phycicoccus sp. Soil748 TaxID=1736397 RepID=UPI0007024C73|nr:Gmad2 immunoglobulin-like domain-containing protein [Phycicoccus sp. Soil748]KRE53863.1 hypothetical protein ASG70_12320 [Phycicoccus sp. Soil748]
MSDRTDFLHPDLEPGELERVERRLRQSLAHEARKMRPGDRLDAILQEAHEVGPATGGTGSRHWLAPVAAAALVAAIAGGAWWATQDTSGTPGPPAGSPSASAPSVTGAPTTAPPTAQTSPTGSTTSGTGATVQAALPAYFVGPIGDTTPTYRLFREFVRGELPRAATDADRVQAALAVAMNAQPYSNTDGYLQPWSGTTVSSVKVTSDTIQVELSGPGAEGFTPEVQRLAVQELVWTAQAALGRGAIPVRFQVAGGVTTLFGSIPTDQLFTRPSADLSWRDLAPIWVTAPTRDQVLPAGTPVTLRGEATVFEATLQWELDRGTTTVGSGTAMATIGAPSRGTYSVDLGRLSAGTYTVRVRSASPKDGTVAAEDSVTFTVR